MCPFFRFERLKEFFVEDELASMLTKRLRDAGLDSLLVMQFAGVKTPVTIAEWISQKRPPRGLRLNALMILLHMLGIESPEFAEVTEYGQYLARLVAFRVITLEQARGYLDVGHDQAVLQTMRGDRDPYDSRNSRKPTSNLEELHELYQAALLDVENDWRKRFGLSAVSHHQSAESQPTSQGTTTLAAEPLVKDEEASSDNLPEAILLDHDQFMADVAGKFASVAALARHLVLYGTPKDRERLRTLLGEGIMFDFSNFVNALCSERAREETMGA